MATDPNPGGHVEPIIKWLFFMVIFLVFAMIGISKWSPNDGQTFQVLSTTLAGFAGALIGRINPAAALKNMPPGSTTHVEQVIQTPPVDPKP